MDLRHVDILGRNFRPPTLDGPETPNVARAYDYLLGGHTNTAADRAHAAQTEKMMPGAGECARNNRSFLDRAVRAVMADQGITQILDLGAGIPTAGGLQAVALAMNPDSRYVGIDNELVAVEYGYQVSHDNRRVRYAYGDFTDPNEVLRHPVVRETLDFRTPVAIILGAALHLVGDDKDPRRLVAAYREAMVTGSALILSHGTLDDPNVPQMDEVVAHYLTTNGKYVPRSHTEVAAFTEGFEVLEPGIALTAWWRPEGLRDAREPVRSGAWAFVGIKR